jgi:hypothetical protein
MTLILDAHNLPSTELRNKTGGTVTVLTHTRNTPESPPPPPPYLSVIFVSCICQLYLSVVFVSCICQLYLSVVFVSVFVKLTHHGSLAGSASYGPYIYVQVDPCSLLSLRNVLYFIRIVPIESLLYSLQPTVVTLRCVNPPPSKSRRHDRINGYHGATRGSHPNT